MNNYPWLEPFSLLDIPTSESAEQKPKLTDEQISKLEALMKTALTQKHKIAVISKEFDYYCPEHKLTAPLHYDVDKYGHDSVDLEAIYDDFVIHSWVCPNGNEHTVETTIAQSGVWTHNIPYQINGDVDSEKEPLMYVEEVAGNWTSDLKGTSVGDLYEFLLACGPDTHAGDPFYWTADWLDQDLFSLEESKKWIAAGIDVFRDAEMFYRKGLRIPDLNLLVDNDSGKTIAYKVVYGEMNVEEAIKFSNEVSSVLNGIVTLEEAAEQWGIDIAILQNDFKIARSADIARFSAMGFARKSGETWILHQKIMHELYGNPK